MSDFIELKTFASRLEAEFAQSVLAESGIRSLVDADDAGGAYTGISFSSAGVRLLIRPDDLQAARRLLTGKLAADD